MNKIQQLSTGELRNILAIHAGSEAYISHAFIYAAETELAIRNGGFRDLSELINYQKEAIHQTNDKIEELQDTITDLESQVDDLERELQGY